MPPKDQPQGLQEPVSVFSETNRLRAELKATGRGLLILKAMLIAEAEKGNELHSEAIANAVLAFRHTEDSAMRLGKVLQALNGGESIYDNSGVVGQK